ncbi:hypothetical protein EsDP_00000631 [Epichloe bromicola]|uniref:Uncharacterized protein n=1 Tax=Epichloe bromicola TaxID=79588 RepID=A0ABQ0CFH2_9HYPO
MTKASPNSALSTFVFGLFGHERKREIASVDSFRPSGLVRLGTESKAETNEAEECFVFVNEDQEEALIEEIATEGMPSVAFLTAKEEADWNLALQLCQEGKITTPGMPFEQSDQAEIDALQARDVFRFTMFYPSKHGGQRITWSNEPEGATLRLCANQRLPTTCQLPHNTKNPQLTISPGSINASSGRLSTSSGDCGTFH